MSEDPRALKLYIDGNAYNNPGGAGGFACYAKYPESSNLPDEEIFREGFHETTNNRMELQACIGALEYVKHRGKTLGVERVQIVTDSLYVFDNQGRAIFWRKNAWKTFSGKPIENSDLWKRFLSVRAAAKVRTEIVWQKGKKSPILKSVDRAAKDAGKSPTRPDRGYRSGKVGRSKVKGGASTPFPANGQQARIHIYRSALIRKADHKVYFDVFDEQVASYVQKCTAYVSLALIAELHRGHSYRVRFNTEPKYPQIVEIIEHLNIGTK
jgi:ribonuclease HI